MSWNGLSYEDRYTQDVTVSNVVLNGADMEVGTVTALPSGSSPTVTYTPDVPNNKVVVDYGLVSGADASVSVGTVSSGATASVTNSGSAQNAVLDFVLPKGTDGLDAQIVIDSVTTVAPGTGNSVSVVAHDTATNTYHLTMSLERGETGPTGAAGATGGTGEDGLDAAIVIDSVQSVAAGQGASVTVNQIDTETNTYHLSFVLERGPVPELSVGTVSTIDYDATDENGYPMGSSVTLANSQLSFVLQRGPQGPVGPQGPQGEPGETAAEDSGWFDWLDGIGQLTDIGVAGVAGALAGYFASGKRIPDLPSFQQALDERYIAYEDGDMLTDWEERRVQDTYVFNADQVVAKTVNFRAPGADQDQYYASFGATGLTDGALRFLTRDGGVDVVRTKINWSEITISDVSELNFSTQTSGGLTVTADNLPTAFLNTTGYKYRTYTAEAIPVNEVVLNDEGLTQAITDEYGVLSLRMGLDYSNGLSLAPQGTDNQVGAQLHPSNGLTVIDDTAMTQANNIGFKHTDASGNSASLGASGLSFEKLLVPGDTVISPDTVACASTVLSSTGLVADSVLVSDITCDSVVSSNVSCSGLSVGPTTLTASTCTLLEASTSIDNAVTINGTITTTRGILPDWTGTQDLGNQWLRYRSVWCEELRASTNSMYLGDGLKLSLDADGLTAGGLKVQQVDAEDNVLGYEDLVGDKVLALSGFTNVDQALPTGASINVSGNVHANKYYGDGSGLTGVNVGSVEQISGETLYEGVSHTTLDTLVAAVAWSQGFVVTDGTNVRVFDRAFDEKLTLTGPAGFGKALAISNDGVTLAVCHDAGVYMYHGVGYAFTYQQDLGLSGAAFVACAHDLSGVVAVASASEYSILSYDGISSWSALRSGTVSGLTGIAFSPNGYMLGVAYSDTMTRVVILDGSTEYDTSHDSPSETLALSDTTLYRGTTYRAAAHTINADGSLTLSSNFETNGLDANDYLPYRLVANNKRVVLSLPYSPAPVPQGAPSFPKTSARAMYYSGGSGSWTVPMGVSEISVAVLGGGGGGYSSGVAPGGGGGGLSYGKLVVTPGEDLTWAVGSAGAVGNPGGESSVSRGATALLSAGGGGSGTSSAGGSGGSGLVAGASGTTGSVTDTLVKGLVAAGDGRAFAWIFETDTRLYAYTRGKDTDGVLGNGTSGDVSSDYAVWSVYKTNKDSDGDTMFVSMAKTTLYITYYDGSKWTTRVSGINNYGLADGTGITGADIIYDTAMPVFDGIKWIVGTINGTSFGLTADRTTLYSWGLRAYNGRDSTDYAIGTVPTGLAVITAYDFNFGGIVTDGYALKYWGDSIYAYNEVLPTSTSVSLPSSAVLPIRQVAKSMNVIAIVDDAGNLFTKGYQYADSYTGVAGRAIYTHYDWTLIDTGIKWIRSGGGSAFYYMSNAQVFKWWGDGTSKVDGSSNQQAPDIINNKPPFMPDYDMIGFEVGEYGAVATGSNGSTYFIGDYASSSLTAATSWTSGQYSSYVPQKDGLGGKSADWDGPTGFNQASGYGDGGGGKSAGSNGAVWFEWSDPVDYDNGSVVVYKPEDLASRFGTFGSVGIDNEFGTHLAVSDRDILVGDVVDTLQTYINVSDVAKEVLRQINAVVSNAELGLVDNLTSTSTTLGLTANQGRVLNETKADSAATTTALALKADASTMNSALALKADSSAVNSALALKANASDVTSGLAGKSDVGHGHSISDVSGLQTALDGKISTTSVIPWTTISGKPSTYPPSAHTHAASDIVTWDTIQIETGTGGSDRYGLKADPGVLRAYASNSASNAVVKLGFALTSTTYNDVLTVSRDSSTTLAGSLVVQGMTLSQGSHTDLWPHNSKLDVHGDLTASKLEVAVLPRQTGAFRWGRAYLDRDTPAGSYSTVTYYHDFGHLNYHVAITTEYDEAWSVRPMVLSVSGRFQNHINICFWNPGPAVQAFRCWASLLFTVFDSQPYTI